jgi:hypothetical protein
MKSGLIIAPLKMPVKLLPKHAFNA